MDTINDTTLLAVTTDASDYAPGATALIAATGIETGTSVTLTVEHVESAGEDGIWGTADDVIRPTDGDGHTSWIVTDGGDNDLDGVANGSITTSWYVNPDDSAGERFLLTAASAQSVAYASFTDTPGHHDPVAAVPDVANYAYFIAMDDGATGSGVIDSFVRIQGLGNDATEEGYNTDYRPQQFDEGSTATFNHSIRLDSVPVIEIDGVLYREFRLDLNDSNDQDSPYISLNSIRIFSSDAPDLTGLDLMSNTFANGSSTLLYDLDGGGDISVLLNDWNTGSGHGDYFVYIPVNGANGNPGFADLADNPYIYLYSAFGASGRTNGGFEEWYVKTPETPPPVADFSLVKEVTHIAGSDDDMVHLANNVIYYEITLTNTGDVEIGDVVVTDAAADPGSLVLDRGDSDLDGVLDLNEVWIYTATHTVTQEEMDAGGYIVNTAEAQSSLVPPKIASVRTLIDQNPDLKIEKVVDAIEGSNNDQVQAADNIIHYVITVTNTGNIKLSNMEVNDAFADVGSLQLTGGDENLNGEFDAGEAWVYAATHTVTQEEMDAGNDLVNVAVADTSETEQKRDEVSTKIDQNPAFAILKEVVSVAGSEDLMVHAANNVINYKITLTNTGNVTLTNISMSDEFADEGSLERVEVIGGNDDDRLDVDEVWVYQATHTVTQNEMDLGGSLVNQATADTQQTGPQFADVSTDIVQDPRLEILKVVDRIEGGKLLLADPGSEWVVQNAGDVIYYTVTVSNTGNVTLTEIAVADLFGAANLALIQSENGNGDDVLDVEESWIYTITHTVTQEEMDAGAALVNTAIGDSLQTDQQTSTVSTRIEQNPHFSLTKITGDGPGGSIADGDGVTILAGNTVTWTYSLKNDGNVSINFDKSAGITDDNGTTVTADDFSPVYQSGDENGDNILSVDEIWIFTATGTAIVGAYSNMALATATFNSQQVTAQDTSSYTGTFTEAWAGRTQGYWGARVEAWDGSLSNKVKGSGADLRAAEINPNTSGNVLIGDLNGNGATEANENTLLVSKAIAQNILSASVTGDNRMSMLQQAIATQLNIYNGDVNPGKAWSVPNSTDKTAGDLITEAVAWLKNYGGTLFADGVLNATDYNLTKSALTSTTGYNKTAFWSTSVDVDGTAADVHATGEDLKNVLMAFNTNKLVTSNQNQVGWNQTTVDPEHVVSPVNVVLNEADAFWLVAQNNISNFGLVWHG